MKAIQPVQIWFNGQEQTGNWINSYITHDNLKDSATFYWAIYDAETAGLQLSVGELIMVEPDYSVWDSTNDINQAAYEWVCSELSLTLI
jgi:hypothetical protein